MKNNIYSWTVRNLCPEAALAKYLKSNNVIHRKEMVAKVISEPKSSYKFASNLEFFGKLVLIFKIIFPTVTMYGHAKHVRSYGTKCYYKGNAKVAKISNSKWPRQLYLILCMVLYISTLSTVRQPLVFTMASLIVHGIFVFA